MAEKLVMPTGDEKPLEKSATDTGNSADTVIGCIHGSDDRVHLSGPKFSNVKTPKTRFFEKP